MRDVYSDTKLNNRKAMLSAYGMIDVNYWTSTEVSKDRAYRFSTNGGMQSYLKDGPNATYVRSVFAY